MLSVDDYRTIAIMIALSDASDPVRAAALGAIGGACTGFASAGLWRLLRSGSPAAA